MSPACNNTFTCERCAYGFHPQNTLSPDLHRLRVAELAAEPHQLREEALGTFTVITR